MAYTLQMYLFRLSQKHNFYQLHLPLTNKK